jgi:hypothetical protein
MIGVVVRSAENIIKSSSSPTPTRSAQFIFHTAASAKENGHRIVRLRLNRKVDSRIFGFQIPSRRANGDQLALAKR